MVKLAFRPPLRLQRVSAPQHGYLSETPGYRTWSVDYTSSPACLPNGPPICLKIVHFGPLGNVRNAYIAVETSMELLVYCFSWVRPSDCS